MKVRVERQMEPEQQGYPKIMESIKTGAIILFVRHGAGVVLFTENNDDDDNDTKKGYYSDAFKMDVFRYFRGKVEIEQWVL